MTICRRLAIGALAAIYLLPCVSQELPSALPGRWQYIQHPDTEGEVLDLVDASGKWRGVMNGLERAGEHGLFYCVVEIAKLLVAPDAGISFEIGQRSFFTKRPALSQLGGAGDGGLARSRMRFSGRIAGEDLVLHCVDEGDGSCPDSTLRFKRLSMSPLAAQPATGTAREAATRHTAPLR